MTWIGSSIYKTRTLLRNTRTKFLFKKKAKHNIPIIVYQMGKVGSTSIYLSIKDYYPGIVLHRHTVNDLNDWQAAFLLKYATVDKKPIKLISLIREPISRNISSFFQNFEFITGIKPKESIYTNEEIKNILLSNNKMDTMAPIQWFHENITKNFGINIFEKEFDKNKGWLEIKENNVELLIMKSEIPNDIKANVIKKFIGIGNFELHQHNVADKKDYSTTYKHFKDNVKFPSSYLNLFYTNPQIKHFYTNEEIEIAYKKWCSQ